MKSNNGQEKIRAIILAAGRGKRMGSLTENQPKCFVKVKNTRLIDWVVRALRGAGIEDIALIRGYLARSFTDSSLIYFDNPSWESTNMVSTLLAAESWLSQAPCIVTYSDIVYPSSTITKLVSAGGDITIPYNTAWLDLWTARFVDPLSDAETFKIDSAGMLLEIGKRTALFADIEGQYMGLIKFTPQGWRRVKMFLNTLDAGDLAELDMTSLLERLRLSGERIDTVPIDGRWIEVDSEADWKLYQGREGVVEYIDLFK